MSALREAAKQALEEYDRHSPLAVVMEELRAALEQPEQEPVAWMDKDGDVYPMPENKNWAPPHTMLYTAPPQRKPLTIDDIQKRVLAAHGNADWTIVFARAIEQAHGIGEKT